MKSVPYRPKLWSFLALAAALPLVMGEARAQAQSRVCNQLEAQLAAFDRGAGADPAQAEQIRRYEDVINRQQFELDRAMAQSRKMGCESRGFFFFSRQPEQCGPLTRRIQEQRANLDRVQSDLARMKAGSGGPERDAQRRAILAALSQNDCGPQYRQAGPPPGGLFEALFGPGSRLRSPDPSLEPSGTYRTVCVRTCDGFYFPISFSTTPARFGQDEASCQRQCPAAEVALFSYPNPGGDINMATSVRGEPYTALPNAFRYRQEVDPACSCRQPGQSWAEALQHLDGNLERGDILVTEPMGRRLSQPRFDAQGKPISPESESRPAVQQSAPSNPVEGSAEPDPNRTVRAVGPTFYPVR